MQDEFFDAIRSVINFARFDETYASLKDRGEVRNEYFETHFQKIADDNGVDQDDLRKWLCENLDPADFGIELRQRGNETVAVARF